jgi:hypothetical protein
VTAVKEVRTEGVGRRRRRVGKEEEGNWVVKEGAKKKEGCPRPRRKCEK